MLNNPCFFSIIIPTYNRAHLITRTLLSFSNQTFESFEVILVDDGSTDDTAQAVKSLSLPFVRYYYKNNGERGSARNFGWSLARGVYISFLDSDDILYPNHLSVAWNYLIAHPDAVAYAQGYEVRSAYNHELIQAAYKSKGKLVNYELLLGNFLSCFGVFVLTSLPNRFRFDECRKFSGSEDWLLWLQIASVYPFHFQNCCTGALLQHSERSVMSIGYNRLLYRALYLKAAVVSDHHFVDKFGLGSIRKIYAHMLSYSALHAYPFVKKKQIIGLLLKACVLDLSILLHRRTLTIVKHLFLPTS